MSTKKVRCKCVRCGKANYLLAVGIDRSEPFICEPCDSKFIFWSETTLVSEMDEALLARFLKEKPCRTL